MVRIRNGERSRTLNGQGRRTVRDVERSGTVNGQEHQEQRNFKVSKYLFQNSLKKISNFKKIISEFRFGRNTQPYIL
jgi:hypothetical protein